MHKLNQIKLKREIHVGAFYTAPGARKAKVFEHTA